ncbi:MAG: FAD-dependent oxidoreductase, partial [Lachnospiraceae bacterium]|nr:FAD-dependent oxidoreductase [Lachnospiraceae bacterium]
VSTADGSSYEGKTVILATGTTHRTLGLPGEDDLIGNGISFCAVCDGDFYRDKTVVMVGGGNSAFVESALLVGIVKKLIILQDLPKFTADQKLQDQVLSKGDVETHVGTKVLAYEVSEDGVLTGVTYEEAGQRRTVACDGVFLAVGLVPENTAFGEWAQLDERGYFIPENICHTKTPGIYVAGDCCQKTLRQVTTACSDGAYAAISACDYLNDH